MGGVFENAFLFVEGDLLLFVLDREGGEDRGDRDEERVSVVVEADSVVGEHHFVSVKGAGEGEFGLGFALNLRPEEVVGQTESRVGVQGFELPDVDEVPARVGSLVSDLRFGDAGAEFVGGGFSGVEEAGGGGGFVNCARDAAAGVFAGFGGVEGETVANRGEVRFAN